MTIEVLHDTFLGLPAEECTYENSRVVIVRAPFDGTSSYGAGARNGPTAIMNASMQVELFDLELNREPCAVGIHTLPQVLPSAAGPEDMVNRLQEQCTKPVNDGKFIFTIGGEHTVSLGAARALKKRYDNISFLQIDAHLDLRDSYEGSPYSHACVAHRLLEIGQLVQVGVRVGCLEELEVIKNSKLQPIWGPELRSISDEELITRVLNQLGPHVYVTVDIDGFDPSVFSATGTPVPGGLGWYQGLSLLRAVGEKRQIIGADVVELAPTGGQHVSDFAAAQLVYKMIGYFVRE